jgi:hypothetical protein
LNGSVVNLGEKYWKLGIQLIDCGDDTVCGLPDIIGDSKKDRKKSRYTVSLTCPGTTFNGDKHKVYDLWGYDKTTYTDMEYSAEVKQHVLDKFYYSFYYPKFEKAGQYEIKISVTRPGGSMVPIPSPSIHVIVKSATIENLKLVENSFKEPVPLGEYLPSFSVELLDRNNTRTDYYGQVKAKLTSTEAVYVTKNDKLDEIILDVNGNVINVPGSIWKPKPTTYDPPLLNKDLVIPSRLLSFTLSFTEIKSSVSSIFSQTAASQSAAKKSNNFGKDLTLSIPFCPGKPRHIAALTEGTIEVEDNGELDIVRIACFDEWGNRTAPSASSSTSSSSSSSSSSQVEKRPSSWVVELEDGPLQEIKMNVSSKTGEAVFQNVLCEYSPTKPLPKEGKEVKQKITLRINSANTATSDSKKTSSSDLVEASFKLFITSSFTPPTDLKVSFVYAFVQLFLYFLFISFMMVFMK